MWIVFYSVTGKKLMAKCRTLIQENQELGRQLSQGRVAQLEAELALQKKYSDELKGSQDGKADNTAKLATVLNWLNKNESELFSGWYTCRVWVTDVAFKLILFVLGSNKLLLKPQLCDVHYEQITITWKIMLV